MKVNPGAVPEPTPYAIIVIFGAAVRPDGEPSATLRNRVEAAARFGVRFRHPLFLPTGAQGRYGDPEATVMTRLLLQAGFPETTILPENTGTDTLSSVRAIVGMLAAMPAAPVYACTSAYHLPRCLMLLRLAGVAARACPPPPVPAATGWSKRWYWRLRETPALPYDAALLLWHRARGQL